MNGWIKHFTDRSFQTGYDKDIEARNSSWTHGKLDGICGVYLKHNDTVITLRGVGEYWQSDDYDVVVFDTTPERVIRRVQKKITDFDYFLRMVTTNKFVNFYIDQQMTGPEIPSMSLKPYKDKWLTVEYNIPNSSVSWYFSEGKI